MCSNFEEVLKKMSCVVDVAGLPIPVTILPKYYQRPPFFPLLLEISIELLFLKAWVN